MRILLIILLLASSVCADSADIRKMHESVMQYELARLNDLVNMLYAQINAMQSEAKANVAKAAEKAAIEKRSKELGCEVEATTGECKAAPDKTK